MEIYTLLQIVKYCSMAIPIITVLMLMIYFSLYQNRLKKEQSFFQKIGRYSKEEIMCAYPIANRKSMVVQNWFQTMIWVCILLSIAFLVAYFLSLY